ncbi:unnamed protein product [Blepharisma stoltei]|uniref:Uncharacterized protein n=1 Tax=Blepharisma stoltei TaxID=1481888 RepID=A0AAU9ISR3_9CILI|nr:unnamed protein product [Blepharisma stoltei]
MGLEEKSTDEFLACSMNCQNKPIYMCDCNSKNALLCLDHCGAHGELSGNHHFTKLIIIPDPDTKMIISKLFKDIKFQIKESQLKIIQESSSLIK